MKSLQELMSLQGRVALITGGAGHIGSALAEALAEAGATAVLGDLDQDRCEQKTHELSRKYPGQIHGMAADLSDEKSCRALVNQTVAQFGNLNILIHSAALVGTSNLEGWAVAPSEQKLGAWEKCLKINLTSAFILSQEAAPFLEKSGNGSIIFLLSIYGLVGPDFALYEGLKMGNPAAYGASKGGLLQLMRYFATALAPKVRVNALTPGGVERGQDEIFARRYIDRTPLRRMGREEDFKGAGLYLASDLSKYVTGQNLVVDGGFTIW